MKDPIIKDFLLPYISAIYQVGISNTVTSIEYIDCNIIICIILRPLSCQNKTIIGVANKIIDDISNR